MNVWRDERRVKAEGARREIALWGRKELRGWKKFLLLARTAKPMDEKCMGHRSGTQLFAWLRGLELKSTGSLT